MIENKLKRTLLGADLSEIEHALPAAGVLISTLSARYPPSFERRLTGFRILVFKSPWPYHLTVTRYCADVHGRDYPPPSGEGVYLEIRGPAGPAHPAAGGKYRKELRQGRIVAKTVKEAFQEALRRNPFGNFRKRYVKYLELYRR